MKLKKEREFGKFHVCLCGANLFFSFLTWNLIEFWEGNLGRPWYYRISKFRFYGISTQTALYWLNGTELLQGSSLGEIFPIPKYVFTETLQMSELGLYLSIFACVMMFLEVVLICLESKKLQRLFSFVLILLASFSCMFEIMSLDHFSSRIEEKLATESNGIAHFRSNYSAFQFQTSHGPTQAWTDAVYDFTPVLCGTHFLMVISRLVIIRTFQK
jgi:hypothetical protein